MRSHHRIGALFAGLSLVITASCGRSPAPPSSNQPTTAAPPTGAPAIATGPNFSHDPADTAGAPEGFITIRLGDRVRYWVRIGSAHWTPATLALLDENDTVLWSVRCDLPPAGSITGALPDIDSPPATLRFTLAAGGFDSTIAEHRIGIAEPELTTERMGELGITIVESATDALDPDAATITTWSAATTSHSTTLDPGFGRVIVIDATTAHSTHTYSGVADDWTDAPRPITDAVWLEKGLHRYLDALTPARPE